MTHICIYIEIENFLFVWFLTTKEKKQQNKERAQAQDLIYFEISKKKKNICTNHCAISFVLFLSSRNPFRENNMYKKKTMTNR